jgi:hypothetical protein
MEHTQNKILAPVDGVALENQYLQENISNEEKINQAQLYRRMNYPPITDYIDGIVKGDQAQIDAYISKCLEVKSKYPKPT